MTNAGSLLPLLALSLAASGCLGVLIPVGDPPAGASVPQSAQDDGGAPAPVADGATTPAPLDDLGGAPATDAATACDTPQSTASLSAPSGHHNAGLECQGCHAGGGAPTFSLGGTLYDSLGGSNAIAGATIHVTDANGASLAIVTAANGNFWSTTPLVYPLKVSASLCPSTQPMMGAVANGACNSCHGSTFRVHLP
jgi:hypothetical protein